MFNVFLVEDDEPFTELLSAALSKTRMIRIVGASATAEAALKEIPRCKPDVILMDIKLPGMTGIECLRRLKTLSPPLLFHVLMLTRHQDEDSVFQALKAGATGYLLKDHISTRELLVAIRDVAAGGAVMSPNVARKVIRHFQASASALSALSGREMEVLGDLAEDLMYKEIAAKRSIAENTVRKHVASIYTKLQVNTRMAAVRHYPRRPG